VVNLSEILSPAGRKKIAGKIKGVRLALFSLVAVVVAAVLFSSFFKNPQGITDAIKTYTTYFDRATDNGDHIYPWLYYFKLLSPDSCGLCGFRADVWLLAAGLAGSVLSFIQKPGLRGHIKMIRFMAATNLLLAVVFSAIPYKTPWNMLAFYTSNLIPAVWFFLTLYDKTTRKWMKRLFIIPFSLIILHLSWQTYADNFIHSDDPCNPFVYAHPDEDVFTILNEAEKVAATAPEGKNIFIEIIVPADGYWPLPWYFRNFPNTGWWSEVDMQSPAAPLIICAPECSSRLTEKLFELPEPGKRFLYIPLLDRNPALRPGVKVTLYLRKNYWDRYQAGTKR